LWHAFHFGEETGCLSAVLHLFLLMNNDGALDFAGKTIHTLNDNA